MQPERVIYANLRRNKSIPAEYSLNAWAVDVLTPNQSYYFLYEKEAPALGDGRDYVEITKYLFFESGTDWVK